MHRYSRGKAVPDGYHLAALVTAVLWKTGQYGSFLVSAPTLEGLEEGVKAEEKFWHDKDPQYVVHVVYNGASLEAADTIKREQEKARLATLAEVRQRIVSSLPYRSSAGGGEFMK